MATLYDLLPVFKQLEVNNLKGLQPGFVVSQMNVAASEINAAADKDTFVKKLDLAGETHYFVENGRLAQITKEGMKAADGKEKALFIAYNEPILKFSKQIRNYATDIAEEDVRLVQLIPGDEWMTDIAPSDPAYAAEIAAGAIAEVTDASGSYSRDDFLGVTTLPDGTKGHHYIYLGK